MSGAIWSCPPCEMMRFPARTLVRFFANHHLLSFTGQPQWRTVTGGSAGICPPPDRAPSRDRIRTNCGAVAVTPPADAARCRSRTRQGGSETYDQVVMASHGDETLALLKDADAARARGAVAVSATRRTSRVLHRDASVMPQRKRCWASWVYTSDGDFLHPAASASPTG